jgi:hypothetical protein
MKHFINSFIILICFQKMERQYLVSMFSSVFFNGLFKRKFFNLMQSYFVLILNSEIKLLHFMNYKNSRAVV